MSVPLCSGVPGHSGFIGVASRSRIERLARRGLTSGWRGPEIQLARCLPLLDRASGETEISRPMDLPGLVAVLPAVHCRPGLQLAILPRVKRPSGDLNPVESGE